MLEDIRLYIMQRLVATNKLVMQLEDTITPSIKNNWNLWKKRTKEMDSVPECLLRNGVARYMHLNRDLEEGVCHWYTQEKWFNAYQFSIRRVMGSQMWKRTEHKPPLPRIVRKVSGRPRKKWVKAQSESNS
ncbi:hypothetical protein Tco_1041172 [Tanacetum coccineum]|uniref:Uncharacterized protein n=1 Tax=Tanacetum coccineum TaxID=301880 RepID=A0ABQ5GFE0_9ASTR